MQNENHKAMKSEKKNNGRARKVRSDSVLAGLPAQKQEALNRWLFEENLSYREVKRRLEEEFGIKTAENSLVAYYRRQALEGRFEKMAGAMGHAKDFVIGYECVESMERAVTQLTGLAAYEMSLEPAERVRVDDICRLMKLVTQSQRHRLAEKRYELSKKRMETHGMIALGRFQAELKSQPTRDSMKQAMRMANEMLEGKVPRFDDELEQEEEVAEAKQPVVEPPAQAEEQKKTDAPEQTPGSTS